MKIDLEKIPQEGLEIKAEEPADILNIKNSPEKFKETVKVFIKVQIVSDILLVRGRLSVEAELVCSRCLKKFRRTIINNDFVLNLDVRGKTEVDITDNIRDNIIILLPVKPLCKPDCKGLCPKCGQDLNERECGCNREKESLAWEDLSKLKIKK